MRFNPVNSIDSFQLFFQALKDNFPIEEYRPYDLQIQLLDVENYHLYEIFNASQDHVGFVAVWEWDDYIFIEHFVILAAFRGDGLGSEFLRVLVSQTTKSIILEVELPDTDIAQRRINFYRRNGFEVCPFDYYMPALASNQSGMPLLIMSYPQILNREEFVVVKKLLYQDVYHVDTI